MNQHPYLYETGSYLDATQRNQVLKNTYLMLALTMIPTLMGALIGVNMNFGFMKASPIISSLIMLAGIYAMFYAVERNKDSGLGILFLLGLTFMMGVLLGPLLQVALKLRNGSQLIGLAAGGTGAVFFTLAMIAQVTKKDFSFMSKFLTVGVVVVMLAVIANLFLKIPALSLALSAAIILLSSGFILFKISEIVNGGETNYISATLSLYIDIYNIFTNLLHILMAFSGDRD